MVEKFGSELSEALYWAGVEFGFGEYMIDYSDLDDKRKVALLNFFANYEEE